VEPNSVFEFMARGVRAGDFECGRRNISDVNFCGRQFFGKGEGDASGAGADVEDAEVCVGQVFLADRLDSSEFENGFDDVFGLGTRNQNRRRDDEVHTPEFLMAGDVLRRNSTGALGKGSVIASRFVGGELALVVSVEIGAVAVESEHQEQFCIQTRRGNVVGGEMSYGGGEGLLQLHESISPQRHRDTEKTRNWEGMRSEVRTKKRGIRPAQSSLSLCSSYPR